MVHYSDVIYVLYSPAYKAGGHKQVKKYFN